MIEKQTHLGLFLDGFNPFIPTRGVGIRKMALVLSMINLFQSIYTYKRRWNDYYSTDTHKTKFVSIHLYLQEALEYWMDIIGGFEPVMFQSIYTYKRRWNQLRGFLLERFQFVSIHLYLQEALESAPVPRANILSSCFNPFIPTRGVGIKLETWTKFIHN